MRAPHESVSTTAPARQRVLNARPGDQSLLGRGVAVRIKTFRSSLVGVIETIGAYTLTIIVKQPLAEGSLVSVEFGSVNSKGEIEFCRKNGGKYEVGVVFPKHECYLRTGLRLPITQDVKVSATSLPAQAAATVVDLSMHGLGLEINSQLQVDETVTVESPSTLAHGKVRHCKRLDDGRFHVGVEVFHIMPKEEGSAS